MKTISKPKIKQLIQYNDTTGMLKNLSELLQEVRDGNIHNIFVGYTKKDKSMRTFWNGDIEEMAEFILLLEQMKYDFMTNRYGDYFSETYME